MARSEEETARCIVPRPDFMRETDPRPLDRLRTAGLPAAPDDEITAHNRRLMSERRWREEREEKAG